MMRQFFSTCITLVIIFSITACGNMQDGTNSVAESSKNTQTAEAYISETDAEGGTEAESGNKGEGEAVQGTPSNSNEEETEMTINIQVGEHLLTAELTKNSSTEALLELLAEGSVTIEMSDYGNMEKVGSLPDSLPRNDEPISTDAGDLILYQGDSFVIYYDTNSWNFTRLGKIKNITKDELKDILGSGDVTVVLSLPSE